MPKIKTHKVTQKRFKVTGTGKIMRRQVNRSHILEKKPSKRTRRLAGEVQLPKGDTARVRRQLGI